MEVPHTISYAIAFHTRLENLAELPKDKRPPRGLLDKPFQLEDYLDNMYSSDADKPAQDFIEFDFEEAE